MPDGDWPKVEIDESITGKIMGMFSGNNTPTSKRVAEAQGGTPAASAAAPSGAAAQRPTPPERKQAAFAGTPVITTRPQLKSFQDDLAPMPRTSMDFDAEMQRMDRPRGSLTRGTTGAWCLGSSGLPTAVSEGDIGSGHRMEAGFNRRRRSSVSKLIKRNYEAEETDTVAPDKLERRLSEMNPEITKEVQEKEVAERRYVIDPEAKIYLWWIGVLSLCATYSSSVVAYQMAFFEESVGLDATQVIEWVIDVLFISDMISNFFVGYYEEDVKVMVRSRCARNYLHTPRFALDFIACLPIDLIQFGTGWSSFARGNKLVRLYSLVHHMKILQGSSHQPSVINTFKFLKLVLIWLLLPHLFACMRILIMRFQQYDQEMGNWKEIKMLGSEDTINPIVIETQWAKYVQSLYWCLGLMTGFGDGNIPENTLQYAFTLSLINIGLFAFAYTVGVLGAMGAAGSQRANDFQMFVHSVSRFSARYGIQDALLDRITVYLRHRWEAVVSGTRELVDAKELLEQLPRTMRYEAVESMTKDTLAKVPLFARVEEGFIHALTQKMQAVNCSIGEVLVRQGEMNETFYIVLNGSLSVTIDNRVMATLNPGSFFGERTLLSKTAAKATVTSTSFCELYSLHKMDLQMLRINFPDTFVGFEQAAKLEAKNADRANRVKHAAQIVEKPMKKWIILPNSNKRAVWCFFLYVALAYDVYMLPYKMVFVGDAIDPTLRALDVLFDLMILADVFLRFTLAFSIDGKMIVDPKLIRQRYMQGDSEARYVRRGGMIVQGGRRPFWRGLLNGTFLPTLLSSLPWAILTAAWPATDGRVIQAFRSLRLIRCLPSLTSISTDRVTAQQPSGLDELLRLTRTSAFDLHYTAQRLLPLLAAYTVLAHYVACGYFAVVTSLVPPYEQDFGVVFLPVSRVEDRASIYGTSPLGLNQMSGNLRPWANTTRVQQLVGDSEWLPHWAYLQYANMLLLYLRSLYYAVCNLTGLGKSPAPLYPEAALYTVITFVVGVLVFAYITSSIVTLVMNANAPLVMYRAKKNALLGYMMDAHVPQHILHRADRWMEHWWYAHGGTPAGYVIDRLPPSLREEVRHRVFQKTTQSSRVFLPLWDHLKKKPKAVARVSTYGEEKTDMSREQMTRELITAMTFEVYNPGEWVLHKGMLNEWVYVVAVGTAEVLLAEPEGRDEDQGISRAPQFQHLTGKVIQELCTGDVFGEISAMYRNKCEASVRAKTPLEVIAIPRTIMMKVLHRSQPLMTRMLELIRKRRQENEFFKLQGGVKDPRASKSGDSMHATIIAKIAAAKLASHVRKKLKAKKAKEAEDNAAAAAIQAAYDKQPDLHC